MDYSVFVGAKYSDDPIEDLRFESSVIQDGSKTVLRVVQRGSSFESSVIQDRIRLRDQTLLGLLPE